MDAELQENVIKLAESIGLDVVEDEFDSFGAHNKTKRMLRTNKNGIPLKNVSNTANILRNDPVFSSLCYNAHSSRYMWNDEYIEDNHIMIIREDLEVRYGLERPFIEINQCVMMVAHNRPIEPVKTYLEGLEWDQVERVAYLMEHVFKAATDEHNRGLIQKISRVWFSSAAGRALFPGCKADGCLVLVGAKGTRKSTSVKVLGGDWFSDSYIDIAGKDGKQMLHQTGAWIWEIPEMYSFKGRSADNAKSFLTAAVDDYRPSYARNPVNRKRRCIFAATTNDFQFLMDGTDRRFLPIQVTGKIDINYLIENRDQIWAEATHMAQNKEPFYISMEKQGDKWFDWETHLKRYQRSFIVEDPWAMKILECLETNAPNTLSNSDLMDALKLLPSQQTKKESNRVSDVCRDLQFQKSTTRPRGWIKQY